jgi:hypothetical protein
MRPPLVLAVLAVLAASTVLSAAPASAAPLTSVDFRLSRGPAVAVPHVEGTTVVDGNIRIPVAATTLRYVGRSGASYVVEADDERVLRVAPGGTTSELARTSDAPTLLSDDGAHIATSRTRSGPRTTVTVRSAVSGEAIARRGFTGRVTALDLDAGRVLVSGPRRTALWDLGTGAVEVVFRAGAYLADLGLDLVVLVGRPLAEGSCSRMVLISSGRQVWASCRDSVLAFNPDGTRWVTTTANQDGPTTVARVRTLDGREVGRYRLGGPLYLGGLPWETPTALLLEALGPRRSGWFRCTGVRCEVAGRPLRNP